MCIYIYTLIHMCTLYVYMCVYIYIYIYIYNNNNNITLHVCAYIHVARLGKWSLRREKTEGHFPAARDKVIYIYIYTYIDI